MLSVPVPFVFVKLTMFIKLVTQWVPKNQIEIFSQINLVSETFVVLAIPVYVPIKFYLWKLANKYF